MTDPTQPHEQPDPTQPPYPPQQQPHPAPPYPGAPPPAAGAPQKPRRSRLPLLLALGSGAVVLALIAVFALTGANRQSADTIPSGGDSSAGPQAADAASAVRGYLQALAEGDAATALGYAAKPPTDTSLLTDEILAASLRDAPIAGIDVAAGSGGSDNDSVQATYRLGDQPVTATFLATRVGSQWRLPQVALTIRRTTLPWVALTIDGQPVTADYLQLFPGSYVVGSSDDRIEINHPTLLVTSPGARPDTGAMSIGLSTKGRAAVHTAAQRALRSCLKKRSLSPAGCGFGVRLRSGYRANTATIRWTITKGANGMTTFEPTLDPSTPYVAEGPVSVTLKCSFLSTDGGSWYGRASITWVQVDLSEKTPKVSFG